jgi:N-acetyl-gamma-glutamyl-phosphate reductase
VATPGCSRHGGHARPRADWWPPASSARGIVVNTLTGITGAGRAADRHERFTNIDSNFTAYGLLSHRHTPEMEQEIGAELIFTPHLVPMSRGTARHLYLRPDLRRVADAERVLDVLAAVLRRRTLRGGVETPPATKSVLGSNACT